MTLPQPRDPLRSGPFEVIVWVEDRQQPGETDIQLQTRLQSGRALSAGMSGIVSLVANALAPSAGPVLPIQVPSGSSGYTNYPLAPPVPVQLHVVTRLQPDDGRELLRKAEVGALYQARLVCEWFAARLKEDKRYLKLSGIKTIRVTWWIGMFRLVLELEPAEYKVVDYEGWYDPPPRGYVIPPLDEIPTG